MPPLKQLHLRTVDAFRYVQGLTQREKQHLVAQLQQTRGLMPMLMKQRNGQRWSREERAELREHLARLSRLSPYLVMVVMPGGFFILPIFAWWLDRRRNRVRGGPPQQA